MLAPDNKQFESVPFTTPDEVTIGTLLDALAAEPAKPLVFFYDGNAVKPGYHVTEVKAGQFAALDCGANPESWTEIFIQLWDIVEGDRTHMTAGKFAAIIRKVADYLSLEPSAKLTFEVSDGLRPMQLYRAAVPRITTDRIEVDLSPRPASCKPRDRWLHEQNRTDASCCGSFSSSAPCCG